MPQCQPVSWTSCYSPLIGLLDYSVTLPSLLDWAGPPFAGQVKVKLHHGLRDLRTSLLHNVISTLLTPAPGSVPLYTLSLFNQITANLSITSGAKPSASLSFPVTSRPTSTVRLIILSCIVRVWSWEAGSYLYLQLHCGAICFAYSRCQ